MKRNWILAGAVAAMMATASAGVRAQTTTDTPAPAPPPPDMSMPMAPPPPMATPPMPGSMPGMMSADAPDYTLLANPLFNYSEIKGAMAKGLSESQVASIIRISKLSGVPVRDTTDKVLEGQTFAQIAYMDNLKLSDVLAPDTEKQQIAGYLAAYESSGSMALKPSMSSMPMSGGGMMAAPKDIVETAMSDKRFKTLVKLLKQANLVDTLKGPGPFTVFAPTDAAFKKLPKNTVKNLTPDQLSKILTYHVLPAKVDAATAMAMTSPTSPPTVEGSTLQVTTSNGSVMVNDATVVQADVQATNGVIHAIDTVLMPPDLPAATTDTTGAAGASTGTGGTSVDTGTGTTTTPPTAGTTGTAGTGAGAGTSTQTVPAGGTAPTPDTGGTTGTGTATTGTGTTGQ